MKKYKSFKILTYNVNLTSHYHPFLIHIDYNFSWEFLLTPYIMLLYRMVSNITTGVV